MIGIDSRTGRTLSDWEQLVSRVRQVITTPVGAREKRRDFGSRVPETLSRNLGDQQLVLAQAFAIDAFYQPINGIDDFTPSRCIASRHASGLRLQLEGTWQGQKKSLEVPI
ncbi:MAG: phage baseplate protein [Gammaproteobacteria bacterium]|nr:phage baseplate protein [Gammaproteobacteria bacterium]